MANDGCTTEVHAVVAMANDAMANDGCTTEVHAVVSLVRQLKGSPPQSRLVQVRDVRLRDEGLTRAENPPRERQAPAEMYLRASGYSRTVRY
jgi:hypothetical protein